MELQNFAFIYLRQHQRQHAALAAFWGSTNLNARCARYLLNIQT